MTNANMGEHRVGNKGSAVSIHSFPKDRNLRKKWEDACGRVQLPKYPYLCSRHFSLAGIPGYKRQLKKDAVPTIFVHKRIKRCNYNMHCIYVL
uniref:THAP domain-containing protein 1 n=1 Tax=Salarias fasciatus TaxID=181472 RepID=A0A672J2Q3_SALFA